VQTLKHLFNHTDKAVSNGYILALAPRLIEHLHSDLSKDPPSDAELQFTVEIINAVESLVRQAEPDKGTLEFFYFPCHSLFLLQLVKNYYSKIPRYNTLQRTKYT